MNSELYKRIISSLFLMCLVFLCALINDYIFLSILFIILILSWIEWIKIIEKISIAVDGLKLELPLSEDALKRIRRKKRARN